ncbi:MAG: nucleotide exchange factor GrpE [Robiginitomaculum sp.]|nr:MAG: nucleotide exchange factor GrpE [Robiginitomaculum sp.]
MTQTPNTPNPDLDGLPTNDELDALQAEIDAAGQGDGAAPELSEAETTAKRIEVLETELATMKDQALRAMAETENVKKRSEREVRAASTYAVERLAADMLSVSDNLGRAISMIDEESRGDLGKNARQLLDGIELTEKDLMAVFARHGIKSVPGKGSKFDPNVHQAVTQVPSSETKGDVAELLQTGFTLGDRTLRAAMVAVSSGPVKVS